MAVKYGASAPGLVGRMPGGPGGKNKENIQRAVEQVEPFGVDLCSSVRSGDSPGLLVLKF